MSSIDDTMDSSTEGRFAGRGYDHAIQNEAVHLEIPHHPTKSSKETSQSSSSRKSSWVWKHYVVDDLAKSSERRGMCKYCQEIIKCPPSHGTTSLNNHLLRCDKFVGNDKFEKLEMLQRRAVKDVGGASSNLQMSSRFDQDECRKALVKMIIIDEMPFRSVESEGFRHFCSVAVPQLKVPSRFTVSREAFDEYVKEKGDIKNSIMKLSSRISLTTDTWTSCQNLSYMCLTTHFVDNDFLLHKKIINFCPISGHSGEAIGKAVEYCLLDWGIERVMAITLDNASSNDVGIKYLKKRLNNWKGTILNGEYLHLRCAVHILNLIVREGLADVDDSIFRIRSAVKYVKSSPNREQKFRSCIEKEKIFSKSLVSLDVETRWNSTYLMLESSVKFEKAFDLLETIDIKYVVELTSSKNRGLPGIHDWERARTLLPFLKIFYDATLKLSGTKYVTGNEYMQVMLGIGLILSRRCRSSDPRTQLMASKMKTKYDKYWGNVENINIMLFVAIVIDPRYKLAYVNWLIDQSYDHDKATILKGKVQNVLSSLYEVYASVAPFSNVQSSTMGHEMGGEIDDVHDIEEFMTMLYDQQYTSQRGMDNKTELDKYLGEDCEDRNKAFEILTWWKVNSSRFHILSAMARDLLAMPTSTVASESAFSAGGRVLDPFRSSLSPRMVEALICGRDWFRKSSSPIVVEETPEDIEMMETGDISVNTGD